MSWILKKQIRALQAYYEGHEDEWGDNYTTLLCICGNANTEKRMHRFFDDSYLDFEIWTTTRERLDSNNAQVWLHMWDPEWDEEMVLKKP